MQLSYIMQGVTPVKRGRHWKRSVYHVQCLTGTTRHQQVLPKSLSRERAVSRLAQLLTLLLHFARGHGPCEPDKTCDYSGYGSPIGEITFPGQWRRADSISNNVPLIQNCHSRDIVQCNRSDGLAKCVFKNRNEFNQHLNLIFKYNQNEKYCKDFSSIRFLFLFTMQSEYFSYLD